MINFVSNLPKDLRSGGFSAMNAAAFAVLSESAIVHFAGPINPPVILQQKAISKLKRAIGSCGDFFFFSQRRLEAIAREVDARCLSEARLDFFHGFTPWVLTKPQRPYVAWGDCTFHDYIEVFHLREQFRTCDIERIEQTEAAWLKNACRILFTSNWAASRAVSHYTLDSSRVSSVGIFGEIEIPAINAFVGGEEFAFISTNFDAKGGRTVLAAFRELRTNHPNVSLTVIGDRPSVDAEPGVRFAGFLRKEIPEEYEQFRQILGRARALVHPTKSDICPLLVIEAGYFGCPVIASDTFAIPELVDNGRTGILLSDSSLVNEVAGAMKWMLENKVEYQRMREASRAKADGQHSRRQFNERLHTGVFEAVSWNRVLRS